MDIYYKLGQINSDNYSEFIYNISVSYKKKNNNYKLKSNINIDLINDYPNYKFIKNNDYSYYRVTTKNIKTDNNQYLNIGDIQKKIYKKGKYIYQEIYYNNIIYKLAEQYEYDKFNYLCNRNTCNAHLNKYIYDYVIKYKI